MGRHALSSVCEIWRSQRWAQDPEIESAVNVDKKQHGKPERALRSEAMISCTGSALSSWGVIGYVAYLSLSCFICKVGGMVPIFQYCCFQLNKMRVLWKCAYNL